MQRMNDLFVELERQALAEAEEEGFQPHAVKLTRLLELRYPHQGYTLPVPCTQVTGDDDKARLKKAFDELHAQVYGQSAPGEDAEIVTFRLQSEIEVERLSFPRLQSGDGRADRALRGERPVFEFEAGRFLPTKIYDRQKLAPGDHIAGPAVIEQFDATTVIPSGMTAAIDVTGTLVIEVGITP